MILVVFIIVLFGLGIGFQWFKHKRLRFRQTKDFYDTFKNAQIKSPKLKIGSAYSWETFDITFWTKEDLAFAKSNGLVEQFKKKLKGYYDKEFDPERAVYCTYIGHAPILKELLGKEDDRRYSMTAFRTIIGKRLKAVYFTSGAEGFEDYSKDNRADFDYLPLGGLNLLFEDSTAYVIANYFQTTLGTDGVGIRRMDEFKEWSNGEPLPEKWNDKIGKEIKLVKIYWNEEDWNGGMKNEFYPESVELVFENGSVFYFCGDVDEFNLQENRYNLLSGRDCGIILYSVDSFRKYGLDKVDRVDEIRHN